MSRQNKNVIVHESSEPVNGEEQFAVTETETEIHVNPVVDGVILDTPVEEVISTDTEDEVEDTENEEVEETETEVENEEISEDETEDEDIEDETEDEEVISNIDFAGRGFKSLEDAKNFINTNYFKGLGKEDQDEYINWLKK